MDVDNFIDIIVQIQAKEYICHWTEEEDDILRSLHGHLHDREIGEILGRSRVAVTLRWKRDLHLPAPTKDPNYITTRKLAEALGLDNHVTPSWVDRGILPGEYIPRSGNGLWRRVRLDILISWLTDPMNWIWFNIHKIKNADLKKLINQVQEKWGDEWWTTNQVAAYHNVNNKDVMRYIKSGRIKAIQAHNCSGRNKDTWANWFILRSEATRSDLKFKHRVRKLAKFV